jgi:TRAP-type mannitol/chloroaromatic compound transport system permease large subunit
VYYPASSGLSSLFLSSFVSLLFNLKNCEKMFNIKIVWFIIMHDVRQKLSNFHGILGIAFYYLGPVASTPVKVNCGLKCFITLVTYCYNNVFVYFNPQLNLTHVGATGP